jgi:hypothetical protein
MEAEEAKTLYEASLDQEVKELLEYDKELRQEFKNAQPDEETARRAKKRVIELVPDAANQIKQLITHAESEAVRKDLAKWVIQTAMQHGVEVSQNDDIANLLHSITDPNSKVKKLGHS